MLSGLKFLLICALCIEKNYTSTANLINILQFIFRLKTVLNGLQRTINSGGSISRGHSRSNSASLLLSPSLVRQLDVGRLNEKFDSSCPTSPGHPTHATESHYATKDDEEETMSDSLSSEGYEGDSETDSHTSTGECQWNLLCVIPPSCGCAEPNKGFCSLFASRVLSFFFLYPNSFEKLN